jgi:hypothetical protein
VPRGRGEAARPAACVGFGMLCVAGLQGHLQAARPQSHIQFRQAIASGLISKPIAFAPNKSAEAPRHCRVKPRGSRADAVEAVNLLRLGLALAQLLQGEPDGGELVTVGGVDVAARIPT